jgi:hypothetical protein
VAAACASSEGHGVVCGSVRLQQKSKKTHARFGMQKEAWLPEK